VRRDVVSSVIGSGETDAQLAERMARGDRDALAMLYELHAASLVALVMMIVKDRTEAEDVVHDVFIEAWKKARTFDAERGTVISWLRVRARSRAVDRHRRTTRRNDARRELAAGQAGAASAEPVSGEPRLRQALEAVPEDQRDVLRLSFLEGLSCAEIADELSVPLGTVKSRMRLGLKRIREQMTVERG